MLPHRADTRGDAGFYRNVRLARLGPGGASEGGYATGLRLANHQARQYPYALFSISPSVENFKEF